MSKSRRRRANVTTEQKVRMLRRHLREDVPISDLCDRYDIQPGQFQTWQKQLRGRRRSWRSGPGWSTIWSGRICRWDV